MSAISGIKTVKATINGQTYTLTLNDSINKYEATITAPDKSSYNKEGHYYPVSITAQDQAGNSETVDSTDPTLGDSLKLYVKETVAPTITNVTPTNGAYLDTSTPTITAQLRDNDSGVDITTLELKVDDVKVANDKITNISVTGGYNISYTPDVALSDASHTVTMTVKDHDGNLSTVATTTFTIMTTAPTLTITAPTDNLKTNQAACTVTGKTGAGITVTISLNGTDVGAVTVAGDGAFSKEVTLSTEGENVIEIVATNKAGVTSTVSRTVIYDITPPEITAVTITPNPVDCGNTYVISVELSE